MNELVGELAKGEFVMGMGNPASLEPCCCCIIVPRGTSSIDCEGITGEATKVEFLAGSRLPRVVFLLAGAPRFGEPNPRGAARGVEPAPVEGLELRRVERTLSRAA